MPRKKLRVEINRSLYLMNLLVEDVDELVDNVDEVVDDVDEVVVCDTVKVAEY